MWIGLVVLGLVIGIILGSFAKALADRLNRQNSLRGRSYCVSCKHTLAWYDLFPVLSYLMLLGKCRYCHQKIPLGNLLAEVIMGFLIVLLFVNQSFDITQFINPTTQTIIPALDIIFKIFIVTILFILFLTDLKTGLLPDKITYPAVFIAISYWLIATGFKSWLLYEGLKIDPIGRYLLPPYSGYVWELILRLWQGPFFALITGLIISLLFVLLIIITKGKGMGWGDVKFVLFIGIALGFTSGVVAIFLAFLFGAVFSVLLIIFGKKHFGQTIPFGPFLSIGSYIALIWGSQLLNWYLNNFSLGY